MKSAFKRSLLRRQPRDKKSVRFLPPIYSKKVFNSRPKIRRESDFGRPKKSVRRGTIKFFGQRSGVIADHWTRYRAER